MRDDIRLHAHDARPAARRCDLPAHRRRLPRSARRSARTPCSACPGLMAAYRAGRVTIANAIGTGIADDKSIYPYVPDMVRFYLGEEPLLANVPTCVLRRPDDLAYTLAHLAELVVKEVHGAGGYGMLIGPAATQAQLEDFRRADPGASGALHRAADAGAVHLPTFVEQGIAPRHIDLRPFVLSGREITIVPGGLTRVALREGSLVVNSSQGGGTKDTWVLGARRAEPHRRSSLLDGALRRARGDLARMLDVHYRLSLLPRPQEAVLQGWTATLVSLGVEEAIPANARDGHAAHGVRLPRVRSRSPRQHHYLPARRARKRARGARHDHLGDLGNLQRDVARVARVQGRRMPESRTRRFLEWVKYRAHLARGVVPGTMLRDEAFTSCASARSSSAPTTRRACCEARLRDPGGRGERLLRGSLRVERAAALDVGVRDLSARLPRSREPGGRHRVAAVARRPAAIRASLPRRAADESPVGRQRPVRRDAAARGRAARDAALRALRRAGGGRRHRVPRSLPGAAARPGRAHRRRLPGPARSGSRMQLRIRHRTAYHYDETGEIQHAGAASHAAARRPAARAVLAIRRPAAAPSRSTRTATSRICDGREPHREIEIVVSGSIEVGECDGAAAARRPAVAARLSRADAADGCRRRAHGAVARASERQRQASRPALCPRERRDRDREVRARRDRRGGRRRRRRSLAARASARTRRTSSSACCRAAGIPARYVSGYLYSGDKGEAASHAWVDAWLGDARAWLGIDVTHLEPTGLDHCRLAVGRDYLDAAPVRGVRRGGGREKMDVNVVVAQAQDQ